MGLLGLRGAKVSIVSIRRAVETPRLRWEAGAFVAGPGFAQPSGMLSRKKAWGVACLGVLLLAGCGGRPYGETKTEAVSFEPDVGTAGYGFSGPLWITLTDNGEEGAPRVIRVTLARSPKSWDETIDGADSQVEFVRSVGGTQQIFRGVRGTVTHTFSAESAKLPRSHYASFGSVSGHIDLLLVDMEDATHQIHLSSDYAASVVMQG
jgi:hypothetical protein